MEISTTAGTGNIRLNSGSNNVDIDGGTTTIDDVSINGQTIGVSSNADLNVESNGIGNLVLNSGTSGGAVNIAGHDGGINLTTSGTGSIGLTAVSGQDIDLNTSGVGKTTMDDADVTGTLRVTSLANGTMMTINGDGTVSSSSDKRLKENFLLLQNTLEKLDKLGGYNYNYKADETKKKQIGVIAQELEKVFPELVGEDSRGFKMVNYQGLIPVLMQAIKEQQLTIQSLNEKVSSQEEKLTSIEADNSAMKKDLDLIKKMLLGEETAKEEDDK